MTKESTIENRLIEKLQELKYTYRQDIRDRDSLERNFRYKFEKLNNVQLTDKEFERLLDEIITPDPFEASKLLRDKNTFERDDGTYLQYTLVNIKDWCKNDYEVVNQLKINTRNTFQRYDVILLVNGLPMVQIELKTLDITPRRALQQIVDYKQERGNGYLNTLLSFMQMFVVSNSTNTFYFSNNRDEHFKFNAEEQFLPVYYLSDVNNKKITQLDDFSDKFFAKCTLGEMISRYMVLVESERKILVMRPYQIYAVKAIVDCIDQNRGNGYIWHTTGSGKTLTSFKTATLLKDKPEIEKCLFVVDRKDLDRQTREEFNKFQEGCVEQNTDTEALVKRLLSTDYSDKVIVTTIQKLGIALDSTHFKNYKERLAPLRDKRMVFIFDECHRSQFGENHKAIKEFFNNAQLFGFTGTPIFEQNSNYVQKDGVEASYVTTEDIFQKQLHAYTITHAIEDKNVLRFHVDYYKGEGSVNVKPGEAIAQVAVVKEILDKHDAVTSHRTFNSIFATSSINDAISYYQLFKEMQKRRQEEDENYIPLHIACVFSPPAEGNQDIRQLQEDLEQEKEDLKVEPDKKKDALIEIIKDYNQQFGTNHKITEFDVYYQDVQQRIKDQKYSNKDLPYKNKIDITIVVDMLLTGFDSKYLNTLYVDKRLKYHGLIQAFSRTNRVLNDTKPNGNILDFRHQESRVNDAIALFSGEGNEEQAKEIWLVEPAPVVIEQYGEAIQSLQQFMDSQGLDCKPEEVFNLRGDIAKTEFLKQFKEVQRLRTQLDQYTDITEEQTVEIDALIPKDDFTSFKGAYLETAKEIKKLQDKNDENVPPEIHEIDFEFVLFSSATIDYDYIMGLVSDMTQPKKKQKMTKEQVISLLVSQSNLMNESEDIREYINGLDTSIPRTEEQIKEGYLDFKEQKKNHQILVIANGIGLSPKSLMAFVDNVMNRMIFDGEDLSDLMEPLNLGWKNRVDKELELMRDLVPILKKLAEGREISGLKAYENV